MRRTAAEIMALAPVIPVLTVERAETGVPLGRALVAGGLCVLEVTLRTQDALSALRRMAEEVEGAVVGAGTVLNAEDLARAVDAGAEFIISPGLTEPLARAAAAAGIPILPGVATASDIMRGLDLGLSHFKFFPAETSGGAAAVAAFAGPFGQCRFCPTGGVTPGNAATYLGLANVTCVGGSWVAPGRLVAEGNWAAITGLAQSAAALPRKAA